MPRLSCTSKKFTIFRLVWVVIVRPQSLNTFTLAFHLRFVCGPERFRNSSLPEVDVPGTMNSSLVFSWKGIFILSYLFLNV